MTSPRIAVIGAGLAGLSCARDLVARGYSCRLFDKGRAPGGRLATRRIDGLQFDHGAQYLTARGEGFAALLHQHAAPWAGPGRWVGTPSMSALPRAMAEGLDIAAARHVTALEGGPGAWIVRHLDASLVRPGQPLPANEPSADGPFAVVVVTLPPVQAAPIIAAYSEDWLRRLAGVVLAPCWTVMAGFAARLPLPDTLRPGEGPMGWAARDSAKPGRATEQECWVIQASPAWSVAHLEAAPETIGRALLGALPATVPAPTVLVAHRWRYSLVERPLGEACLYDAAAGLGLAGDWCLGGRAEAAFDSGTALAAAIAAG